VTTRQIDHARIEQRIGRHLTAAEKHVDVEAIDALLNQAKDDLDAAIQAEQQRLGRALAQGYTSGMRVTDDMLAILRRLREAGQAHALAELASMGYPRRAFAVPAQPPGTPTPRPVLTILTDADAEAILRLRLRALTTKIHEDALGGDLSSVAITAIEKAVVKVLGARSIAADLVAPAFDAGLGQTFEAHADLVAGWQVSEILDGSTCDPCAASDGDIYDSWEAIQEVLPNGGPNVNCLGGDRCRGRAVPVPPE
jgi:hypothetical protein